jgi:MFS family permease
MRDRFLEDLAPAFRLVGDVGLDVGLIQDSLTALILSKAALGSLLGYLGDEIGRANLFYLGLLVHTHVVFIVVMVLRAN